MEKRNIKSSENLHNKKNPGTNTWCGDVRKKTLLVFQLKSLLLTIISSVFLCFSLAFYGVGDTINLVLQL